MLFNDTVNYWDYIALTRDDEWMSMKQRWNDTDTGKPNYSEKCVPLLLCPQGIPHGARHSERPVTNDLKHGTA